MSTTSLVDCISTFEPFESIQKAILIQKRAMSDLLKAAKKGNLAEVQRALAANVDVNMKVR